MLLWTFQMRCRWFCQIWIVLPRLVHLCSDCPHSYHNCYRNCFFAAVLLVPLMRVPLSKCSILMHSLRLHTFKWSHLSLLLHHHPPQFSLFVFGVLLMLFQPSALAFSCGWWLRSTATHHFMSLLPGIANWLWCLWLIMVRRSTERTGYEYTIWVCQGHGWLFY